MDVTRHTFGAGTDDIVQAATGRVSCTRLAAYCSGMIGSACGTVPMDVRLRGG